MKRLFILTLLLTGIFTFGVYAQWDDTGKLNAWTFARVARANKDSKATPYLKEVRVAKNKGYDRVVFEFTGDIPRYFVESVKPPITGTADVEIKVSGKYFVGITLQLLPYPDEEAKIPAAKIPEGKLNFPVVSEIREIEWFEGDRPFVIGLKAKKLFRVQQLRNPARLVVD
ncbi:MAG TPA: hypothetical protein VGD31_16810, partial [Sphingobacteriaceae bacterium]